VTITTSFVESLFSEKYEAAAAAHREATKGPFNPFGDSGYDSGVWSGTLADSVEARHWVRPQDEEYEYDESEMRDPALVERLAKEQADEVIGTGRVVAVALYETCSTVFCEEADGAAVREAVAAFYDWTE
jgi:hypothetical protein